MIAQNCLTIALRYCLWILPTSHSPASSRGSQLIFHFVIFAKIVSYRIKTEGFAANVLGIDLGLKDSCSTYRSYGWSVRKAKKQAYRDARRKGDPILPVSIRELGAWFGYLHNWFGN